MVSSSMREAPVRNRKNGGCIVIPAKAGIQYAACASTPDWIPAFAGMPVDIGR